MVDDETDSDRNLEPDPEREHDRRSEPDPEPGPVGEHAPDEHLKRVREYLQYATEGADGPVQTQLNSLTKGVFEEQADDLTAGDDPPKADRIEEIAEKLDGLAAEADGKTTEHILAARDHCLAFLEEGGGEGQADSE
ncbi:DUF7553 family protein [Halopiger aswanensis]|uniref:Uncharacterized protein n=1 Tax=Halopiger aswanensis TaxID=148449 RepID=A0A419WJI8_9EURY|nr:hypothetical protein [Halopiger aswanensis]RKD95597.1 hypothetical protein ATJ93_2455 [Halopiger aswanensis]